MKKNVVTSLALGFATSMTGNTIIKEMFPPFQELNNGDVVKVNNGRWIELSSYSYGMIGWFWPFVLWVEFYYSRGKNEKFLLRQSLLSAFIVNSFIFGIAVMAAGIVRKLYNRKMENKNEY